ncbi:hypothetical protein AMATHDRAFT_3636 [Amanita thiersii Skay4041]|uniref:Mitochondrial cytochrome c oxidase subunit VIa n=1 Tax=Amanita thiersii Skay4041 TaxID=703135 RepID=A0A2A9NJL0_9AGAR|nr:hypothetical protein AMATHDRAFT_3636 [Amanita thiersii Skay4041]
MSFIARNSLRAVVRRSAPRLRSYTTEPASVTKEWLAEQEAHTHHAAATTDLWRKISFYVCVPGIATCIAWVYNVESEHAAHIEHLKEENDGHLPEVPGYDYLNKRAKPFPWGMNSLFFNSHSQKDMEA